MSIDHNLTPRKELPKPSNAPIPRTPAISTRLGLPFRGYKVNSRAIRRNIRKLGLFGRKAHAIYPVELNLTRPSIGNIAVVGSTLVSKVTRAISISL